MPEFLAGDLAALTKGKPYNLREVTLEESLLRTYVGVYEGEGVERLVTVENGKMFYQRVVGESKRDANGKVVALVLSNKRGCQLKRP